MHDYNAAMHAEDFYLFRHQLVRDAAYDLQLPADRAKAHLWAMEALDRFAGGPAPNRMPMLGEKDSPHPVDPFASGLARHATAALEGEPPDAAALRRRRLDYLWRAAAHAGTNYRVSEAADLFRRIFDDPDENEPNRAEAARLAADMLRVGGGGQQALPLYEAARELAHDHAFEVELALTLDRLGSQLRELGRMEQAEQTIRESIVHYRTVGERRGEARALRSLSIVLQQTGRFDEAVAGISLAMQINLELQEDQGLAADLGTLANLHFFTGEFDKSEEYHLRALETERRSSIITYEGSTLANLAILYSDTGRHDEAEELYHRAIEIHRQVGNRRSEGIAIGNLASLLHRTGRLAEARALYQDALEIHRECGNRRSQGVDLGHFAMLLQSENDFAAAESMFRQALALHREVRNRRGEGITLGHLASLQEETGELEKAAETLEAAIELHRAVRNRRFEAGDGIDFGLLLLKLGRTDEARKQWQTAYAICEELITREELEGRKVAMRKACEAAGVPPLLP